jgi:hypothetical protein
MKFITLMIHSMLIHLASFVYTLFESPDLAQ